MPANRNALEQILKNPASRTALRKLIDTMDNGDQSSQDGITCELCNDEGWWPENGFSESERQAICGPQGINCPGFGEQD